MTRKCNIDPHWCGTWGICPWQIISVRRRTKTCLTDYSYALFTMSATIDFSNDKRKAKRHWRDWFFAVLLLHHQDGVSSLSACVLSSTETPRGRLPFFFFSFADFATMGLVCNTPISTLLAYRQGDRRRNRIQWLGLRCDLARLHAGHAYCLQYTCLRRFIYWEKRMPYLKSTSCFLLY